MKKLLLTLTAIACIIGCSGEITIESGPTKPAPEPRLVWHKQDSPGSYAYLAIIEDRENGVEYLYASGTQCVAICPMIKKEITAEKKE